MRYIGVFLSIVGFMGLLGVLAARNAVRSDFNRGISTVSDVNLLDSPLSWLSIFIFLVGLFFTLVNPRNKRG